MQHKLTIGRTDRADFPDLNLDNVEVKVDTGAYTSSIHCSAIREEDNVLHAIFLDEDHPSQHGQPIQFTEYEIASVKSSNGQTELRYEVRSSIRLFGKKYKISLTLSDRAGMRFPVLLGRKFLSKKFIVDTELQDVSYLSTQHENPPTDP